ncbi:alpha/beta hydrolase [Bradyrhizobium sp.]|uniref:alpha/beta fold hydrolase n=1 Tax=Bradyrhizobium sp. TaxID=376 RepID=UPI002626E20E|nr:alpha/beta hydrolase [Bradyrhizobium sp.]
MAFVRELAEGVEVFRRSGEGQRRAFVLLHGVGSNAHSFDPLMQALPLSVEAIAWNAPGYGQSKPLAKESPAPRDYAAVLAAVMDRLGISRAVLVGHSLGSLFAASFAAHYPERVSALALLSPALGYRVSADEPLPPAVQQRIDELNTLGPEAFARKRAARLVADPVVTPHVLVAVERAMAAVHPQGYAQAVRALGAGDMLADLDRVSAPALVAVGSKDVITPPDNAKAARDALRGTAEYHEVTGSGHALPQEEPALVAKLLAAFIRENAHV